MTLVSVVSNTLRDPDLNIGLSTVQEPGMLKWSERLTAAVAFDADETGWIYGHVPVGVPVAGFLDAKPATPSLWGISVAEPPAVFE
jgi:hypothetical protein